MDAHGHPWTPMDIVEFCPWVSMNVLGRPRTSKKNFDNVNERTLALIQYHIIKIYLL